MLILSRKLNESIVIDGRIEVKIMRIDGDVVKLGIAAPADVPVHREEVYEEIRKNNRAALTQRTSLVPKLSTDGTAPRRVPLTTTGRIANSTPDTEPQNPNSNRPKHL